jgi:acyl carrier protein
MVMASTTPCNTNHVTKIIQIMVDKFAVDECTLSYEASFSRDLRIDSLDMIEFIAEVEKTFKIKIPDEEIGELGTVGALIEYVEKHT